MLGTKAREEVHLEKCREKINGGLGGEVEPTLEKRWGGEVEPTLEKRWSPLETHEKKLGVDF